MAVAQICFNFRIENNNSRSIWATNVWNIRWTGDIYHSQTFYLKWISLMWLIFQMYQLYIKTNLLYVLECWKVLSPTYFPIHFVWWWEYFIWC